MIGDDVFEILDFLDDIDEIARNASRPRMIRNRPDIFNNYDDMDFINRYRLSKQTALIILDKIVRDLEFDSNRNESVSPINQLLIALRFYATGGYLITIGDAHGVSVSTASRIVKKVSHAICISLRTESIKFPSTDEDILKNQQEFYNIAHFPYVIGTIDCTHIKIQSPGGNDSELFRNRKGYFSLNVQTISDARLKIINVVARWPGSTHDSAIFTNSQIWRKFELGQFGNACLLGDSGYPLKDYLLTPYLNPQTEAQERYNASQIRTRNTVERQYGVLKRRFPALALGLRLNIDTAIHVIVACCILHNYCIDLEEEVPPNDLDVENLINDGQIEHNYVGNQQYGSRRDLIAHNYFI